MDRELSREAELDALRARLFTYRIGPETAVLSFCNRLAGENRWTPGYARWRLCRWRR